MTQPDVSTLVFASAPEAAVRRALARTGTGDLESLFWLHPEGSPFATRDRAGCWGRGPMTWGRALRWAFRFPRGGLDRVILPLNNADGAGYGPLRFLARWLSAGAVEVPLEGKPRPLGWDRVFSDWELLWHRLLLRAFEGAGGLFRLGLRRFVPPLHPPPRPPMHPVTVQDHYTEDPPEVSIIIRTFNEERYLAATLEQIALQEGPTREVIVIDSESTDRTLEVACSYSVRVYRIPRAAFHYSTALNLGAELARGRLLVHLSAHSVPVGRHWLAALVEPLLQDPRVAGVCGREIPIEGWASPFERKLLSDLFPARGRVMTRSFFFSNANAAVRRDCVLKTPFDDRVDWGEDQVWAHTMHQQGYTTVYTPDSVVAHSHNLSLGQCFARTLKFQRTLFRRMYRDRVEEACAGFRRGLPARALGFRRFLTEHRLMSYPRALVYAPFCEFVNYLGCDLARREWRGNKLDVQENPAAMPASREAAAP